MRNWLAEPGYTPHNASYSGGEVRVERELREVDGSVMLQIPAEMLRDLRWEPGRAVILDSGEGELRVGPTVRRPPAEAAEFIAGFVEEYDEAMRELADR